MICSQCGVTNPNDAAFCGNCSKPIRQLQAIGAIADYKTEPLDDLPTVISSHASRGHHNSVEGGPPRGNFRHVALFAVLILLLIGGASAGAIVFLKKNAPAIRASANGQALFLDGQNSTGHTDALKITINALQMPPSGFQYDAWFINEQDEHSLPLGTLLARDGTSTLNFASNGQHINLLGVGNKIEITLEQGDVKLPTGKVILVGAFPALAFVHIKHLLSNSPTTPGHIGLLVGLQDQTQLLNLQALTLSNIAASGNAIATRCLAQSLVDIIEGAHGPHFQQFSGLCVFQNITTTGDGFGLLGPNGYVAGAAEHASLAATQVDTTDNIRKYAGDVEIATNNIEGWVTAIEQDALNLLAHPQDTTKVEEIVRLSDQAHHGVDRDGDAQVNPVPGEAGAIVAYLHGQLMATLTLVPPSR